MVKEISDIEIYEERVASLEQMLETTTNYMLEKESEINEQKEQLEYFNRELFSSLTFGALIQNSLMPSEEQLSQTFRKHFVFHEQKDVVGGDLLWLRQKEDLVFFACIDCTGHGVPGAMLSMGAYFSLNALFDEGKYSNPKEFLENYSAKFHDYFNMNSSSTDEFNQGLDIGLVVYDKKAGNLSYCGTHQSLIATSGSNNVQVLKGNRGYIGNKSVELPIIHHLNAKKINAFYLHTDGIVDQFGGPKKKKLQHKRLHEVIGNIQSLNLQKQGEILKTLIMDWKGSSEQTDDMLLVGFKF